MHLRKQTMLGRALRPLAGQYLDNTNGLGLRKQTMLGRALRLRKTRRGARYMRAWR